MVDFYHEILARLQQKPPQKEALPCQLDRWKRELALKYHLKEIPTNIQILLHCSPLQFARLKKTLLSKPIRSISGVAPVAIMTKPFPCPHGKCTMCPGGVKSVFGEVPQSYTGKEPATMRGIRHNFDPYLQVFNRLEQYLLLGQNCEKAELILMGGTFPSFPLAYQEEFVTFALKAMNDFSQQFYTSEKTGAGRKRLRSEKKFDYLKFKKFFEHPAERDDPKRAENIHQKLLRLKGKSALKKEQQRNERAAIRCVALCIETRPDYGKLEQGQEMLRLGCTRVELGIQSVYDSALERIRRGHTTKETIESIKILKDLGFKVAAHYLPGLPGVNFQKDLRGMKQLFENSDYRPDMLKIYPCMVLRGTPLFEEYRRGKFTPLNADDAARMISLFKETVPEYCRIMRIQRDIPSTQVEAGVKITNLRQYLRSKYPVACRCIRCREPKGRNVDWKKVKVKAIEYAASGGKEFFVAAEDTAHDWLLGFLRMRFPSRTLRPEITLKSALIRELHVYGTAAGIGESGSVQHRGLGKELLAEAEKIARKNGQNRIVVISGVGVREYYRKLGYHREGPYMVKELK